MSKYQKLPDNSSHATSSHDDDDDVEMASAPVHSALHSPGTNLSDELFKIRVLNRESTVEVSGLLPSSTIKDLKEKISLLTSVTPENQRLIFSGRALRPDDALLSSFNIQNDSSIHLFPKPPNAPSVPEGSAQGIPTPTAVPLSTMNPNTIDLSAQDIPLTQNAGEVKTWSSILVFLSVLTLFDNFSRLIQTGTIGLNVFDSLINLAESALSVWGLYVGQMGLQSVQTFDMEIVQKYVKSLTLLGVCCIVTRFVWIADFVLVVKQVLKNIHIEEAKKQAEGKAPDPNTPHVSDSKLLITYGIQAVLVAFICLAAWSNCMVRARRFRDDVHLYRTMTSRNQV